MSPSHSPSGSHRLGLAITESSVYCSFTVNFIIFKATSLAGTVLKS